jgi:hypothetical protein
VRWNATTELSASKPADIVTPSPMVDEDADSLLPPSRLLVPALGGGFVSDVGSTRVASSADVEDSSSGDVFGSAELAQPRWSTTSTSKVLTRLLSFCCRPM